LTALESSQLEIETGDGVTFTLPLAGPVSRFLALTVDWAIVATVIYFLSLVFAFIPRVADDAKNATLAIAFFVLGIGYGVTLEWWWGGRTLGKRVVGLRVVDVNGLRLTFSQVLIRNLLRAADSLPAFYLVGGTVMIASSRMQRLGDLAAGTVVVSTREAPLPQLPPGTDTRVNSLRPYRALAARLRQKADPAAARIALEALKRRDALDPEARLKVFAEIAAGFRTLVEFPEEATLFLTDEQYLWNVVEILYERPGYRRKQGYN
jgi:uncharacterized RDD family membrane protein YckC